MLPSTAGASDLPTHLKPDLFCAARVADVFPVHQQARANTDLGTDNEFAVRLIADAPKVIAGTIDILSNRSLYSFVLAPQTLTALRYETRRNGALIDSLTRYISRPLYFELPTALSVQAVWLADVQVNGIASTCATLPFVYRKTSVLPGYAPAVSAAPAAIRAGAPATAQAARFVRSLDPANCDVLFEEGRMVYGSSPPYPAAARQRKGTVLIQIALDAAGHVADAAVLNSSGDEAYDAAGLVSVAGSVFAPAQFLCVPVPGFYSFQATFGP